MPIFLGGLACCCISNIALCCSCISACVLLPSLLCPPVGFFVECCNFSLVSCFITILASGYFIYSFLFCCFSLLGIYVNIVKWSILFFSVVLSILFALVAGAVNSIASSVVISVIYSIPLAIFFLITLLSTVDVGIILFPATILCLPEFLCAVNIEFSLFLVAVAGAVPVYVGGILALIIGIVYYSGIFLACFVFAFVYFVFSPAVGLYHCAFFCVILPVFIPLLAVLLPFVLSAAIILGAFVVFFFSHIICLGFLAFDVLFFLYEVTMAFLMLIPFVTGIGITICSSYIITIFPITIALFTLVPTVACLYLLFWFTLLFTYPFALLIVIPGFCITAPVVGILTATGTLCGTATTCMMLPSGCSLISLTFPFILIFTLCAGVSLAFGGTSTGILFGISVPILFICLTFSIFPICAVSSPLVFLVLVFTLLAFGCSSIISFILSPFALLTSILGGSSPSATSGGSVGFGGLSSIAGSLLGTSGGSGGLGMSTPALVGILPTISNAIFGEQGCIPSCQRGIFGTGHGNEFGMLSYASECTDICGKFTAAVGNVSKDSIDVFARHWCSFKVITDFISDAVDVVDKISTRT